MRKIYQSAVTVIACAGLLATPAFAGSTYNKYDGLGRLVLTSYPNGSQAGYHYDTTGNRDEVRRWQITAPPSASTLSVGTGLIVQATLKSPNLRYTLVLQEDGNLVLLDGASPIWNAATYNKIAAHVMFQSDGNLVLYDQLRSSTPLWHSNTAGASDPNATVVLQNDGKLILNRNGTATQIAP
jgi:YD repeat-containing protein